MKKIYLSLIAALFLCNVQAQFNVTFQVDMNQQTVGGQVSVAGNFQLAAGFPSDWDPASTVMTDPNVDNIYTVTVNIPAGSYEYKYINGNSWGQDEMVPGACATNSNRAITISSDTTITPFCFGSCNPCPPPIDTVYLRFSVDMREEMNAGPVDSVSVAGDFQSIVVDSGWVDWTPGITLLTDPDMDSIYTAILPIIDGTYEYKFINGTAWGQEETVPAACVFNLNRQVIFNVPAGDTFNIPTVCFGMCTSCPEPIDTVYMKLQVDMRAEMMAGPINTVTVAGDFQDDVIDSLWTDWSPGVTVMTDPDADSIFTAILRVPENTYQFKFLNGTTWGQDETVPAACAVNSNREITINSFVGDTVEVGPYCFGECTMFCSIITNNQLVQSKASFEVFPNPFGDYTIVEFEQENTVDYDIMIFNTMGQIVQQLNNINSNQSIIYKNDLKAGLYLLTIHTKDGQQFSQKIIIE